MFADCAIVIREEIAELARLGCDYIQIDAPELANLVDPEVRRTVFEERGIDPKRMLGEGVEILDSLAGHPDVTFGLHLCRGNNDGRWLARGGYDSISREVFQRARGYDEFLLEYDDARSGSFAPLADVPRDKRVVLGLVTTKRNLLESADELNRRIDDAARISRAISSRSRRSAASLPESRAIRSTPRCRCISWRWSPTSPIVCGADSYSRSDRRGSPCTG